MCEKKTKCMIIYDVHEPLHLNCKIHMAIYSEDVWNREKSFSLLFNFTYCDNNKKKIVYNDYDQKNMGLNGQVSLLIHWR